MMIATVTRMNAVMHDDAIGIEINEFISRVHDNQRSSAQMGYQDEKQKGGLPQAQRFRQARTVVGAVMMKPWSRALDDVPAKTCLMLATVYDDVDNAVVERMNATSH